MNHTATYSPEDNKLRLYPACRLSPEDYARVKAAGFGWAPKQELFFAVWTPAREDLLTDFCGQIDDEDKSLVERAEERAERFDDYSAKREKDAESAHAAVAAIADNIPFGQPILVGHHSERHARKDAARIESGMRRAVKMWETSQYWEQRAAGALRHAKHLERADVRARRIKTIEADKRKIERNIADTEKYLKAWQIEGLTLDLAKMIASRDHISKCFSLAEYPAPEGVHAYEGSQSLWSALDGGRINETQARDIAVRVHTNYLVTARRWLEHDNNRLAYERAMLGQQGGLVTDQTGPEKGGAVRCWVARGNWLYIQRVNKVSVTVLDNWGNGGRNFTRVVPFDKLTGVMTAAQVEQARADGLLVETEDKTGFHLLTTKPVSESAPAPTSAEPSKFEAMKDQLRAGVEVVAAPQLFPTPAALAREMVELAGIGLGHTVLEPSAGTGRILDALQNHGGAYAHAIEIDNRLAGALQARHQWANVQTRDFLATPADDFVPFDAVVMNPPFAKAADVAHIKHALGFLKPGGTLVAICANGPRQQEELRPLVESRGGLWRELPAGTFAESGTDVRTVLLRVVA
jgi:phospholipid N-methyltransferase